MGSNFKFLASVVVTLAMMAFAASCGKEESKVPSGTSGTTSGREDLPQPSHRPIDLAETDTPALQFDNAYQVELGRNGSAEVLVFENTSNKPIQAFKGRFVLFNKFNEEVAGTDVEYTERIAPNSKLYINRIFIDDQLNSEKGTPTSEFLDACCKKNGVTAEQMRVTNGKFILGKVVQ